MKITLVGPGRLGRSLDVLFSRAGHQVCLVSRGEPVLSSDVVLLTVPDTAIAEVASALRTPAVVLHCSGSRDVEILRPHQPAGSFHPLMTFPGVEVGIPDLRDVPVAVCGDRAAVAMCEQLANDLGMRPFEVTGDRALYHCAAVMAGNFATVLLAEAARALAAAGVPESSAPAILAPLALASIRNAAADPQAALTGPAVRGDHDTLEAHRQALARAGLHDLSEIYDRLTESAIALGKAEVGS